jgi:hypothetical protein
MSRFLKRNKDGNLGFFNILGIIIFFGFVLVGLSILLSGGDPWLVIIILDFIRPLFS